MGLKSEHIVIVILIFAIFLSGCISQNDQKLDTIEKRLDAIDNRLKSLVIIEKRSETMEEKLDIIEKKLDIIEKKGKWKTADMSTGLHGVGQGGGIWYGAYEYLTFSEADEGYILEVEVQSDGHELRIELWEGLIEQNDHYWWITHSQEVVSTGSGNKPQIESKPQLRWTIRPGNYTLFFAGFNHSGEIVPYTIYYKIE